MAILMDRITVNPKQCGGHNKSLMSFLILSLKTLPPVYVLPVADLTIPCLPRDPLSAHISPKITHR